MLHVRLLLPVFLNRHGHTSVSSNSPVLLSNALDTLYFHQAGGRKAVQFQASNNHSGYYFGSLCP